MIEARFALPAGMGTALEIFGESTAGLLGYGFIYTNKESLSIGTGALLEDLIESGINVNDMLDRFKAHPAIAPLIAGGETIEYSGHLIPEGGYNRLPQVFARRRRGGRRRRAARQSGQSGGRQPGDALGQAGGAGDHRGQSERRLLGA